jgi:class 3 adenylate cyclase
MVVVRERMSMLNRLASFRLRRGLSESEFADELGVSKQTIVAVEKGKYDPSLPLAKEMARFFRVAVEDIFPTASDEAVLTRATFVMTDIEASTLLVKELGEAYVDVLRVQRDILIDAFTSAGGRVVDDSGDATFAAFDDPDDAIRASLAAQRAIATQEWPAGVKLKIRMGIHTGEAFAVGNRFVGLAVHEAARVCQSAAGGQILVSESTATDTDEVTKNTFRKSAPYTLRGVGERRLYLVGE